MKYKFVIRSPLTVGEEVCIDKKKKHLYQDVSVYVRNPVRLTQEELKAILLNSSKLGTVILIVRH